MAETTSSGKKSHTKGFVLGAATTALPAYFVGGRSQIPTKVFDWIIANGLVGLCLVGLFLLGAFSIWCLRELLRGEAERREEQEKLLREQTKLVEAWQGGKVGTTELLLRLEKLLEKFEGAP